MRPDFINKFLRQPEVAGYDDFRTKGDLYYMCQIKNFADHIPPATYKFRETAKQSSIDSADIIIFGDSFFDHSRYPSIADRLHDSLGMKVHLIRGYNYDPALIAKAKPNAVVILGIVERNIVELFDPHQSTDNKDVAGPKLIKYLFPGDLEKRYLLLARRSYLTEYACEAMSTFSYNNFHLYNKGVRYDKISDKLFLGEVFQDSQKDPFKLVSESSINTVATNVQNLASTTFKGRRFIFFPAPNKESLYYRPEQYNHFLPKLCAILRNRQVSVVDVYDLLKNKNTDELYFRTDTHWNGNGISLAFSELRKILALPH
jgi:hypothetical protein